MGAEVRHAEESSHSIGVVGLGRMGLPIAGRLAAAGLPVVGYDVAATARRAAENQGVALVDDLPALAAEASIVLVLVPADDDVRAVVAALLAADDVPEIVAICSSVEPQTAREMGTMARARGVDVCDATLAREGSRHHPRAGRGVRRNAPGAQRRRPAVRRRSNTTGIA